MPVTREKSQLMSASEIDRTLVRLAHEVLERTADLDKLVFIGVRRRGVPLAQRLAQKIQNLEGRKIPVGRTRQEEWRAPHHSLSRRFVDSVQSTGRERDRHSFFRHRQRCHPDR